MFFSKHAVAITLPPPLFSFPKHSLYLLMAFDLSFHPPFNRVIRRSCFHWAAAAPAPSWDIDLLDSCHGGVQLGDEDLFTSLDKGVGVGGQTGRCAGAWKQAIDAVKRKGSAAKNMNEEEIHGQKKKTKILSLQSSTYPSSIHPLIIHSSPLSVIYSCIKPIISVIHPSIK